MDNNSGCSTSARHLGQAAHTRQLVGRFLRIPLTVENARRFIRKGKVSETSGNNLRVPMIAAENLGP
jgi:hypothetical protein